MTPEQQRIAIAEACGWEKGEVGVTGEQRWIPPNAKYILCYINALPDYLNDLNAMHEAEKVLTGDQWSIYFEELQMTARKDGDSFPNWRDISPSYVIDCFAVRATAAQRAKAFLKTIGKRITATPDPILDPAPQSSG